jgi:hypothetical protein
MGLIEHTAINWLATVRTGERGQSGSRRLRGVPRGLLRGPLCPAGELPIWIRLFPAKLVQRPRST